MLSFPKYVESIQVHKAAQFSLKTVWQLIDYNFFSYLLTKLNGRQQNTRVNVICKKGSNFIYRFTNVLLCFTLLSTKTYTTILWLWPWCSKVQFLLVSLQYRNIWCFRSLFLLKKLTLQRSHSKDFVSSWFESICRIKLLFGGFFVQFFSFKELIWSGFSHATFSLHDL